MVGGGFFFDEEAAAGYAVAQGDGGDGHGSVFVDLF